MPLAGSGRTLPPVPAQERLGGGWCIGQSPRPSLQCFLPPPGQLTSLSENLCFWELDSQAETGSAMDGQNEQGYNPQEGQNEQGCKLQGK